MGAPARQGEHTGERASLGAAHLVGVAGRRALRGRGVTWLGPIYRYRRKEEPAEGEAVDEGLQLRCGFPQLPLQHRHLHRAAGHRGGKEGVAAGLRPTHSLVFILYSPFFLFFEVLTRIWRNNIMSEYRQPHLSIGTSY